ncbi:MAG: hypothetical protein VCA17_02815 [Dehalococcoidia bacterium]
MADRDNARAVRILVLVVALIAMIAPGTTPSARATLSSRLIVFAFCFTLAIVMVTTIALIPSPPDPRELRHRIFGSTKDDLEENADDRGSQGSRSAPAAGQHRMYNPGGYNGSPPLS